MLRGTRALVSLAGAIALVIAPMLAPEHVHEVRQHHHDSVSHRHVQPHHLDGSVSDADGSIVWLTIAAVPAPGTPQYLTVALERQLFELAAPAEYTLVRELNVPGAAHGPPLGTLAPRAPPASA